MFTPQQLEDMLKRVGNALPREIDAYLIGGCAMGFRGLKNETKDVDIVLLSRSDLDTLGATLTSLKFSQDTDLEEFYLSAVMVFTQKDSRIDLFVRDVCKSLIFTDRMVKRAQLYKKLGKMNIYLVSNEDIFLFKGITDRAKDIDDCAVLLKERLADDVILDEMTKQAQRAYWCFFVYEKLCIMEETLGLQFPLREKVKSVCLKQKQHAPRDFLHAVKNRETYWG